MKVLLVYPPNPDYCVLNEDFSCCEPLGLEYIGAALLPSCEVTILDLRLEAEALDDHLRAHRYGLIGVSIPFTTSINVCNALLAKLRAQAPTTPLLIGGHYPSTCLDKLDLRNVDYIVKGEGVHAVAALARALARGQAIPELPGLGVCQDGAPRFGHGPDDAGLEAGIDDYPLPARGLLARHRERYFHAHYSPITLVRFSAGCPYSCSFCILWKLTDRRYLTRSVDPIIEELAGIDNGNVYVVDDEAFIQAPRMVEIARAIRAANIRKRFHMYVRADTVVNNPALFADWAEAGLDSVLVGLESVFPDDLVEYAKSGTVGKARRCVDILHGNGIEIRANFIVKPDYTVDKFRRVRDAVMELQIDKPTFAVLTPFTGTDTFTAMKDQIILDKPEFYDCYHSLFETRLPLKEFYREFAALFRSANERDQAGPERGVFYAGKGDTFESFVSKIESSYRYYEPGTGGG